MSEVFSKYYQKTRTQRLDILQAQGLISPAEYQLLRDNRVLAEDVATNLIENQIGQFPLPLGIAPNFLIDGQTIAVPLVVEEPSVVAACSNGAQIIARDGGFTTESQARRLVGQIILTDVTDVTAAAATLRAHEADIIATSQEVHPSIVARGGGVKEIEVRLIDNENGAPEFLTVHLLVDVQNAMGANIVNTILEGVQPYLQSLVGGQALMSILSNYNEHSLVTARCRIAPTHLATKALSGEEVAAKIVAATRYANLDPYRATTHNKGIMNGIDSLLLATGNDPRANAAGIHAFAARAGQYRSLSKWTLGADGYLEGELTLPLAVGTVGGAINVLPLAQTNLNILGCTESDQLARIAVAVGLAQNFAALRALVSVGIQQGHMSLHANALAIHAGASGEEIALVAKQLKDAPTMNSQRAAELLAALRDS